MSDQASVPRIALLLGFAGLIPFFTAAGLTMAAQEDGLRMASSMALTAYGAAILSFLGGVRWGHEVANAPAAPDGATLVSSILPSILAWCSLCVAVTGLMIRSAPLLSVIGLGMLIVGFGVQGAWDTRASGPSILPLWYRRLRILLSVGALMALGLGLFAAWSALP